LEFLGDYLAVVSTLGSLPHCDVPQCHLQRTTPPEVLMSLRFGFL
jgi:hypothetical protein